jgi:hypothetical protein
MVHSPFWAVGSSPVYSPQCPSRGSSKMCLTNCFFSIIEVCRGHRGGVDLEALASTVDVITHWISYRCTSTAHM